MPKLKLIKMMSNTHDSVFRQLDQFGRETWGKPYTLITRLYSPTKDISALEFFNVIKPKLDMLRGLGQPALQVWNEPNHFDNVEGNWTPIEFAIWAGEVAQLIRSYWRESCLIFAPMAEPDFHHHGTLYLEAARDIIDQWYNAVGVHCYWQNWLWGHRNETDPQFGERYKSVAAMFPDMDIHILEAGNSNYQNGHPMDYDKILGEYRSWLDTARHYSQVRSASFYIYSTPDLAWEPFAFNALGGERVLTEVYK